MMPKGLSLDQFKAELEGDARKRCLAQEKTIKELHIEVADLKQTIKEREKLIEQFKNRCFAMTRGAICIFCGQKNGLEELVVVLA